MHIAKLVSFLCDKAEPITWETPATQDGCRVLRLFMPNDRYLMDFADGFSDEGWLQFDTDQDAAYFGVWVNPKLLVIISYAEGEWTIVECPDKERYNREIGRMIGFYGEGFIAKVIHENGAKTTYRQDRKQFVII